MKSEDATKYAAILFLLIVGIGTVFTTVWNLIHGMPLQEELKLVITSGITYSLTTLSINHGSNVALKGVNNGQTTQSENS